MNKYPEWWNQTITLYNKFEDPQTKLTKWYRTVLTGCFWKYTGAKLVINNNVLSTDTTICRIPASDSFKNRYEWINLSNDEMPEYFTLGAGDIIICGEVSDEIDEYTASKRATDVLAKYRKLQGCIVVDTFTINVGGNRVNEHYYITGA